jgi:hypothetical protein
MVGWPFRFNSLDWWCLAYRSCLSMEITLTKKICLCVQVVAYKVFVAFCHIFFNSLNCMSYKSHVALPLFFPHPILEKIKRALQHHTNKRKRTQTLNVHSKT